MKTMAGSLLTWILSSLRRVMALVPQSRADRQDADAGAGAADFRGWPAHGPSACRTCYLV